MSGQLSKGIFIPVLVLLMLFIIKLEANADVLCLKNGRNIEGVVIKEDENDVSLEVNCGVVKFSKDQINSIQRASVEDVGLIRQQWASEKEASAARAKEIRQKQEREPKEAVLDKQSGQVMVVTTLNKKVQANLVLDTGASYIALSSKIAASLGIDNSINSESDALELILADGRKVKAKKIILDSVNVQGSEVEKVEAAVLSEQEDSVITHDGLLGMSFLKNFTFKVDQKNDKLTLEKL